MIYDIHVHTSVVDGRYSPRQVVEHAKKIGLNGIAIVDHDEVRGNHEARKYAGDDFQVISGIEFSTTQGHILCLSSTDVPKKYLGVMFKKEDYRSPEEIVDLIHDIGGIAVAAHPYDRVRAALGDLVYKLPFDAIEVLNGHTLFNTRNPSKVADELKLPKVGGSDAHSLHEIGNICVEAEGDDVVEAIRSNRVRVVTKGRLSLLAGFARSGILKSYFKLEKY
jgi:predicted metal-dependent phosphoesterase TrpH